MKKIWKRIKNRAEFYGISIIASIIWEFKIHLRHGWKKIKEWLLKLAPYKLFLSLSILFVIIILTLIILYINWISAPDFWEIAKNKTTTTLEIHSQISRNRSWLVWMVISLSGLAIGIGLTTWGRIIQHKSHLNERYEKAAAMLGNEVMPVRVAGCLALMSLGTDDKSMKEKCVSLLFSFINDPYLKLEHQDKNLDEIFPEDEPLRADIQQAVDSFCAIYNHYGNKGIDEKQIRLPSYFWKNRKKGLISLIKANLSFETDRLRKAYLFRANFQGANLRGADLEGAYLYGANLREAKLWFAKLQGLNFEDVNLKGTELHEANISNAKMEDAKNLTTYQILSAKWGVYKIKNEGPPSLPDEIKNDPKVKKWLAISWQEKMKQRYG